MDGSDMNKDEELRLLYQVTVSDLASYKRQQWQVTNYGLLLYAAIISIQKLLGNIFPWEVFALIIAAIAICASSSLILIKLDKSIKGLRRGLTELRRHFTNEFRIAWEAGRPELNSSDDPDRKLDYTWFFCLILIIGLTAVIWLLIRLTCAYNYI